jgi:hypothetical protein
MNSLAIYQDLLERGFQFQLSGDRLDVKGTTEPLTTEVISLMRERKQEIIALVAEWQKGGPFLQPDGSLVIPFNSDPQYHYWAGGMKLSETKKMFSNGPFGPRHVTKSRAILN